ncbi:expressed unknown protein [Seminavis robusta]|uniref:EF-hand domain-containing protein n=1 Tax=Seminavis robusta TaxID=568900 RepID=A0A9N8H6K8_9STRA|nr:expressed unknown protein [Seminavis robusta]|eukprot:Sro46_g027450.1 n/a (506) ;mRNA; f:70844-72823
MLLRNGITKRPLTLRIVTWVFLFLLLYWNVVLVHVADGYCTEEEQRQAMDQDVFYKCVRRISAADENGDDLLDRHELTHFIKGFSWSLFVVSPFPNGTGTLKEDEMNDLFASLVNLTGHRVNELGQDRIDVYGSNIQDMPEIDQERFQLLHAICDHVVQAFEEYQPLWELYQEGETEPPKFMVLEKVKQHPLENTADEDSFMYDNANLNLVDDDDDDHLLSVHASFIIVNFEGLEAHDLPPDSIFLTCFEQFLETLLATECDPALRGNACLETDDAYDPDTGSLCGSHEEYVRRIFCGELELPDGRRRGRGREILANNDDERLLLLEDHAIENVVLYRIQNSNCPIPMMSQGEAGSQAPLCQTIYAHYMVHLMHQDLGILSEQQRKELETVYTNVTQTAIHNGMLQDSLRQLVPDSPYFVEGQGFRLTPMTHHHHQSDKDESTNSSSNISNAEHPTTMKHYSPYHHHHHERLLLNQNKKPCTRRFLRGKAAERGYDATVMAEQIQ